MSFDSEYQTANSPVLSGGESILWRGKPKKFAFIATKSLTMMPIAVLWIIIDLRAISTSVSSGESPLFLIPFFAMHLMPVWIWLGNVITAHRSWKHTAYYATNRRIIIQSGFWAVNEVSLFYKDLRNVHLQIGFLDKVFHTGDICFDTGTYSGNHNQNKKMPRYAFEDMGDASQVYSRIQRIVLDMQTDMEYPNAYRPSENPGYQTDYH